MQTARPSSERQADEGTPNPGLVTPPGPAEAPTASTPHFSAACWAVSLKGYTHQDTRARPARFCQTRADRRKKHEASIVVLDPCSPCAAKACAWLCAVCGND